jgi:hypothetical protein
LDSKRGTTRGSPKTPLKKGTCLKLEKNQSSEGSQLGGC